MRLSLLGVSFSLLLASTHAQEGGLHKGMALPTEDPSQLLFGAPVTAVQCPMDQTVRATSADGSVVTYGNIVAFPERYTVELVSGLPSGSTFPVGRTINEFKVTDKQTGDVASCRFAITVKQKLTVVSDILGGNPVALRPLEDTLADPFALPLQLQGSHDHDADSVLDFDLGGKKGKKHGKKGHDEEPAIPAFNVTDAGSLPEEDDYLNAANGAVRVPLWTPKLGADGERLSRFGRGLREEEAESDSEGDDERVWFDYDEETPKHSKDHGGMKHRKHDKDEDEGEKEPWLNTTSTDFPAVQATLSKLNARLAAVREKQGAAARTLRRNKDSDEDEKKDDEDAVWFDYDEDSHDKNHGHHEDHHDVPLNTTSTDFPGAQQGTGVEPARRLDRASRKARRHRHHDVNTTVSEFPEADEEASEVDDRRRLGRKERKHRHHDVNTTVSEFPEQEEGEVDDRRRLGRKDRKHRHNGHSADVNTTISEFPEQGELDDRRRLGRKDRKKHHSDDEEPSAEMNTTSSEFPWSDYDEQPADRRRRLDDEYAIDYDPAEDPARDGSLDIGKVNVTSIDFPSTTPAPAAHDSEDEEEEEETDEDDSATDETEGEEQPEPTEAPEQPEADEIEAEEEHGDEDEKDGESKKHKGHHDDRRLQNRFFAARTPSVQANAEDEVVVDTAAVDADASVDAKVDAELPSIAPVAEMVTDAKKAVAEEAASIPAVQQVQPAPQGLVGSLLSRLGGQQQVDDAAPVQQGPEQQIGGMVKFGENLLKMGSGLGLCNGRKCEKALGAMQTLSEMAATQDFSAPLDAASRDAAEAKDPMLREARLEREGYKDICEKRNGCPDHSICVESIKTESGVVCKCAEGYELEQRRSGRWRCN